MGKYNNEWVIQKYQSGETIDFFFFWGHRPNKDGSIEKSCLSQWWEAAFTVDNIMYKTAEHWMMAEKARLFEDDETLPEIIQSETPGKAKKLGRKVKNFDPVVWDQHRFDIVVTGNYHKFSQYTALKNFLFSTKDTVLVEASPLDRIWGIGIGATDPDVHKPSLWKGFNLLGYALMEVRNQLKNECIYKHEQEDF